MSLIVLTKMCKKTAVTQHYFSATMSCSILLSTKLDYQHSSYALLQVSTRGIFSPAAHLRLNTFTSPAWSFSLSKSAGQSML